LRKYSIIRNLEEYYDNELLHSVSGIFNGSSNYILSKVFNENQQYTDALKKAQELGFAETDPTLDVGGFDPKFKVCIVASHAYGIYIKPDDVFNIGIDKLGQQDIRFAKKEPQDQIDTNSKRDRRQQSCTLCITTPSRQRQHAL
jgi:homoserine dehydrogenase